ncbi:efflux RND transporter periplasmic adaptor subunit [Ancylomarina sp. 16SWW S1-10-2]|uniref:efflux RND transporter periplasmic adaptor subunit n=1 Tax=Ancylomarina sp. 16SWW S1-10-2 TaxID=2499681 RepID=UPI0012AD3249|nr:efflux RND transporter periplasmic adaptor subunit [Ancylomarina sp. 16SWW S1-10-2]MRT94455.1 efflux RND transporter periplasmic adaptor subunit [Ancylomarina sp. 16SWW S1-10-2]
MKKVFRTVLIVLIIGLFIGTLFFIYNKSKAKVEVYDTKSPEITDIIKKTVATGSVVPRKEIKIKPQGVSGIVETLFVEAGQMLKKGDKIAKIKIIPDMINLNSAESRVERAQINFEDAQINYNRDKLLFEKNVISESDFQKPSLAYRSAQEELKSAKDNLQLIKEGVTSKSDGATNTIIRSTIEGMILDIPVKEGYSVIQSNTFNEGTTVAVVADMGEMIFQGMVDETEVGRITEGMNIKLTIGAIDDFTFDAHLEYISPKGVAENGAIQFEIKAAVKLNKKYFIRSGYSANAEIVLDKKEQVLVINESLLEFKNDSTFVNIETEPQVFERRYVKTGLSDGINIEVLEGVKKGDKIKGEKMSKIELMKEKKKKRDAENKKEKNSDN